MRKKTRGRMALAVVMALASLMAVGAGTASAAPGTWSSTSGAVASGSLTLTRGAQTATCPNVQFNWGPQAGGGWVMPLQTVSTTCTRPSYVGTFQLQMRAGHFGSTDVTAGVATMTSPTQPDWRLTSPWGTNNYQPTQWTASYVNGNPSQLVLNNTVIGNDGTPIRATGTLNMSTFYIPGLHPVPPPLTLN